MYVKTLREQKKVIASEVEGGRERQRKRLRERVREGKGKREMRVQRECILHFSSSQ